MKSTTATTEFYIDTFNSFDTVLFKTVIDVLSIEATFNGIMDGELRSLRFWVNSEQEVIDIHNLYNEYQPVAKEHQGYLESIKRDIERIDDMFKQLNKL